MDGDEVVRRARALVGVRFGPGGRSAAGIDCVGLVALATGCVAPAGYAQRGTPGFDIVGAMRRAGLAPVAGARRAGDVLLLKPDPRQWHLAVWTGAGIVHADAGLGRVCERPGAVDWPVAGVWRVDPAS